MLVKVSRLPLFCSLPVLTGASKQSISRQFSGRTLSRRALACTGCIASSRNTRSFSSSTACNADYGFIGLGMMGKNMAANLYKSLSSDDVLHVYDTVPSTVESFIAEHPLAKASDSSTSLIQASSTVLSSLPNTSHVQSIFSPFLESKDGASPDQLDGKLFVDTSTISPAATKLLSDALTAHGAVLVDAPVSGGVIGAQAGTLTFMISQPTSISSERLQKLLSSMGKRIITCGDYPGAGLAAKLANNYALAMTNLATCDAMLLGEKLGLDPKILAQVLNTSTGKSWPSEVNNPVPGVSPNAPASRDYNGGFGIGLMRKDLELALQAEKEASVVAGENRSRGSLSDLSRVALDLYKTVEGKEEFTKKDFSVVYQHLKQLGE